MAGHLLLEYLYWNFLEHYEFQTNSKLQTAISTVTFMLLLTCRIMEFCILSLGSDAEHAKQTQQGRPVKH
jgi:hypothetical protein